MIHVGLFQKWKLWIFEEKILVPSNPKPWFLWLQEALSLAQQAVGLFKDFGWGLQKCQSYWLSFWRPFFESGYTSYTVFIGFWQEILRNEIGYSRPSCLEWNIYLEWHLWFPDGLACKFRCLTYDRVVLVAHRCVGAQRLKKRGRLQENYQ